MAYLYDEGGYSLYTPSASISTPSWSEYSANIPSSLASTSALINSTSVTSCITSTTLSPYPPKDIVSAIESLADCSQTILFECLANSKCNPSDFACICEELKTLAIESEIVDKCTPEDEAQYADFQDNVCSGIYPTPPVSPSSIIVTLSSAVVTPSASNTPFSTPMIPIYNTTVTKNDTTTTVPVRITSTQTVLLTTTNNASKSTTIETVVPGPGYPTVPIAPAPSEYTGAAGSMKLAALAGAIGFLSLVFAGL